MSFCLQLKVVCLSEAKKRAENVFIAHRALVPALWFYQEQAFLANTPVWVQVSVSSATPALQTNAGICSVQLHFLPLFRKVLVSERDARVLLLSPAELLTNNWHR